MKKQSGVIISLLYVLFVFVGCSKQHTSIIKNPLPLNFGDPFLLHASDGKYYMYGTSLANGFEA
ncbi:MAG: glycoside hydrolase, partial [Prevotella buccalis]|nr:glycoside hydrolase [Hoylesella buccalis]